MANSSFPILQTQRLTLNQLTSKDRQNIFAIFSDPEVVEHYDTDPFRTELDAVKLIKHFEALCESNAGIRWAIRDSRSGEFLGSCGFTNWNRFDHTAVVGYELAKQYWGKGYANEAIAKIIDFILDESFSFYVHRIEAYISPNNKPSIKLIKRHGFQFEGTLREKSYWGETFHDMNVFSLLRRDRV